MFITLNVKANQSEFPTWYMQAIKFLRNHRYLKDEDIARAARSLPAHCGVINVFTERGGTCCCCTPGALSGLVMVINVNIYTIA